MATTVSARLDSGDRVELQHDQRRHLVDDARRTSARPTTTGCSSPTATGSSTSRTTPTASRRPWVSSTGTSSTRAGTSSCGPSSAPTCAATPDRSARCTACPSRSGPHGARAIHVIGDFNGWDRMSHPMRALGDTGIWELFLPGAAEGMNYQFAIRGADGIVRTQERPDGADDRGLPQARPRSSPRPTTSGATTTWMQTRAQEPPHRPDERLRGPHRLVAPGPELRRHRRALRQLRQGPRLHPRRVPARDGAPLRPVLGLPRHRLLRAELALGLARRVAPPHRPPAPGRHRGHPRLGPRSLRHRRVGPGPLRRPGPLREPRPAQGVAPGVGLQHLRLRPRRGAQLPRRERRLLARGVPRRRAAGRRRRLDALPRLRADRPASGSPTRTAAGRTSRRCG